MKIIALLVLMFALTVWVNAQSNQNRNVPPASSKSSPQKDPPTLGFNHIKDVSPIIDQDAMREGQEMEKKLPNNPLVHDKEGLHETALMNEFVEGFKDSKECHGITFYLKNDKKPDFTVQIMVSGHDNPSIHEQTWTWILGYPGDPGTKDAKSHGFGGLGNQSSAKLTARDVCLTIWDDVDPNHFKKPGGRVE